MTKKGCRLGRAGPRVGGVGLLHILALQDKRPFNIAFMDRAPAVASSLTALAIGTLLLLRPHERRLAPLIILATLLLDAVFVSFELGAFGIWVLPACLVVTALAAAAGLLAGENKRERIALGVVIGVGVTVVLVLAVHVLETAFDLPVF
jgi:4-amino-4-deoxy-L-arabinose transferase-like glycosyltransferase